MKKLLGLLIVLSGCVGGASDFGAEAAELRSLPLLEEQDWQSAPAGCEGRVGPTSTFATVGIPGLGAVTDDHRVVCVDTFDSLRIEVTPFVHKDRSPSDWIAHHRSAFRLTRVTPDPQPNLPAAVDPDPQPNLPTAVDPDPQPNLPTAVDPDPQPNLPTGVDPDPQPNLPTAVDPDPQPNREPAD